MTGSASHQAQVVIVGAGPAGLAMAIELGHRGIPCLLVERNDRVGYAPRAKTTHIRTREHMRRWGIAEALSEASPLGVDYPSHVHFVTRLNGHKLATFENSFNCSPEKNALYAEHAQWIPQYSLEEVMRRHAETLPGVELRFCCEMLAFEQSPAGVTVRLRDLSGSTESTIQCDYLVGADGSRSHVREAIGATMQGQYGLSRNYNIIFRAPGLHQAHPHGPGVMYWQVNGEMPSLIGPMDNDDKWYFMPTKLPAGVTFSEEEAQEAIRIATGIDLPYEILSSDEWIASSLIADRYRKGRVFLVGDACHLHPPFGGFGMFLGVLDSVDLGWKLAAVLQGQGGEALLDTYEIERKQVHEYVVEQAVSNHKVLSDRFARHELEAASPAGADAREKVGAEILDSKRPEFRSIGVVLGYRYETSPIIVDDGSEFPPLDSCTYTPSAKPGCRAPHAWLPDGTSLFDHFGPGFTLLITDPADAEITQLALRQADDAGISLSVTAPLENGDLTALYQARYVLIRPDQHVAWRGNEWPDAAPEILRRIAGYV